MPVCAFFLYDFAADLIYGAHKKFPKDASSSYCHELWKTLSNSKCFYAAWSPPLCVRHELSKSFI